jgi:glycosyltransferase involved in cell wall biosynthesis
MIAQQKPQAKTDVIKVVHVITGLNIGGAEQMLLKLLSNVDNTRFDFSVISLITPGVLAPVIEALGIPIYTLNLQPGQFTLRALFRLRKIIKFLQPDVIQGWMYHANLAVSLATIMYGKSISVVWNIRHSLHMLEMEKSLTKLVIKVGARLSHKPYKVIYNSYASVLQHQQIGYCATNHVAISNGFDGESFKPDMDARISLRDQLGISSADHILIGLIGRYHPLKDHDNFLHAAALLLQKKENISFVMVGANVDAKNHELQATIEKLGMMGKVFLLGESHEIPRIMAGLDIHVSSSQSEAFSNVIGEAMVCGIPCVVTDVGDSARLVGDAGVVVVARDPHALMEGLLKIVNMNAVERTEIGLRARQHILNNFSIAVIVSRYEALYLNAKEAQV